LELEVKVEVRGGSWQVLRIPAQHNAQAFTWADYITTLPGGVAIQKLALLLSVFQKLQVLTPISLWLFVVAVRCGVLVVTDHGVSLNIPMKVAHRVAILTMGHAALTCCSKLAGPVKIVGTVLSAGKIDPQANMTSRQTTSTARKLP
jgi:hypothetical protein